MSVPEVRYLAARDEDDALNKVQSGAWWSSLWNAQGVALAVPGYRVWKVTVDLEEVPE